MLKRKQLVKRAFKEPDLYTSGELNYMKLWNQERKRLKKIKKRKNKKKKFNYVRINLISVRKIGLYFH